MSMEGPPQAAPEKKEKEQNNPENIELEKSIEQIKDMYVHAAERYLPERDALRLRIIEYYAGRPQTDEELEHVLTGKNKTDVESYVEVIKNFTDNESVFIERMERVFELQDTHRRRRELESSERLASEEEYELGAFTDVLESQVKDAVLSARKKGYLTFQSGFREKDKRDQFMDFYNKNISIPAETLQNLKERGIEVKIEHFDDRTTLTLHPSRLTQVRLSEWKEIWDDLVRALPPADSETVPDMETYKEHINFRQKQDLLRKSAEGQM